MEKHTLCVVEEPRCRLGEKARCGLCVNSPFSGSIQSCAGLYTNRSRFSRGPALQKAGSDSPGCWAELHWPPHPAGAHPDSSSRWAAHSRCPGAGGGRPAWGAAGFAVGWFGGPFIVLTVSEVGKRMALHVHAPWDPTQWHFSGHSRGHSLVSQGQPLARPQVPMRGWPSGSGCGDTEAEMALIAPAARCGHSPHLLTSLRQGRDPLSGTWRWWPGGQEPDSCCEGVMGHMKEARAGASTREKPGVQKFLPRPGAGSPQGTPHPGVGSLFLTGCLPLTALTLGVHQDDLEDAKSHSRPQPHLEPRAVLARIFFFKGLLISWKHI